MTHVGSFVGVLVTNACLYPSSESSDESSSDEGVEKYSSPDQTEWNVKLEINRDGGQITAEATFQPELLSDFERNFYSSNSVSVEILENDSFRLVWPDIEQDRISVTLERVPDTDTYKGNWEYIDNPEDNNAEGTLELHGHLKVNKPKSAAN